MVVDVQATDVSPRAFSVVWASSEPVNTASVEIFTDAAATTEVTGDLTVQLAAPAAALAAGLVKVDVSGTAANKTYPDYALSSACLVWHKK